MSLLLYMLGCGIQDARTQTSPAWLKVLDDSLGAGSGTAEAARNGWRAELRGDLAAAQQQYDQVLQSKLYPRWVLRRAAAVALRQGQMAQATEHYSVLAQAGNEPVTELVYATLLLAGGSARRDDSRMQFHVTIGKIATWQDAEHTMDGMADGTAPGRMRQAQELHLQTLVRRGTSYLKRGRYERAAEMFEDALREIDLLLAAHAAWAMASEEGAGQAAVLDALVALAALSDALLRYLARTKLAGNVAEALRQKNLRDDLAPWATGGRDVERLLRAELDRLTGLVRQHPDHAELHFRVGLAARAVGEWYKAERAFRAVLAICPEHAAAAGRLAAMHAERGEAAAALELLKSTVEISPETVERYGALALAAKDAEGFEQTVAALERSLGGSSEVRANLAFALTMMGALEEEVKGWKEADAGVEA